MKLYYDNYVEDETGAKALTSRDSNKTLILLFQDAEV